MDRGKAFEILADRLNSFRSTGYAALLPKVGTTVTDTVHIKGEPISIESTIEWADRRHENVRVTATAYGPSSWRLERLVESIELKPE